MFTYLAGNTSNAVQEADIEILTSNPRNAVLFTNQPSYQHDKTIPKATQNKTLPGKKDWTKWHVYRMDWLLNTTTWYVNNEMVAENSLQVPRDPSRLILNMWSDGGSWTGNMTLYDEAYLQIQWIEIAYNTSGPFGGAGKTAKRGFTGWNRLLRKSKHPLGCDIVCGVDEQVNITGTPQVLYNSSGMSMLGKNSGLGSLSWVFVLLGCAITRWT